MHEPLEDDLLVFAASDTDASDARRDLGRLLEQLPDHQRLPILHMKLEGLSVIETAQVTGMSESAVKVGVHRGLKDEHGILPRRVEGLKNAKTWAGRRCISHSPVRMSVEWGGQRRKNQSGLNSKVALTPQKSVKFSCESAQPRSQP